ncbi:MAG: YfcC family protein [Leptotrichia sp.]|jgi:C4-dicarboxylate anaerobic carrier protein|nr:YfcC family protein [Leptotrichia sp.]
MEQAKKKGFKMPSSYTVLFILIIILAILTWIIPAGEYEKNEAGQLVAGTYKTVQSNPQGIYDIFMAPVYGLIGNKLTTGSIGVAFFILIIGGFLGVITETGALDIGIASVIKKNKGKEKRLIPLLMILFAIGGTTYGMAEETIAFYPLLIPIMIGVGFDTITAVAVILVGSQIGCLASTVNPFATGVASDTAGISIADGIVWRLVFLVVMVAISIFYVYSYATKIEKNPEKSFVYSQRKENLELFKIPESSEAMTKKQLYILWIFILTFFIMILSLIPWGDFGIKIFEQFNDALLGLPVIGGLFRHASPFGTWYFSEITMLFFVSSVLIGVVYGMSEDKFLEVFLKGAADLIGVALICAVSRGIQIIMNDGLITATILHWGEIGLKGLSPQLFITLTYLFYLPMSFLIPGTSSLAGATMGLLGPMAEFVHVRSHLVITAFQAASGVLNLFTPTSGVVMGALAIARIDIIVWIKFLAKLILIVILMSIVILVIATFFY